MALARVRGCAGQALGAVAAPAGPFRQADASRRQNGPRKTTSRRSITVRLSSKSCPAGGYIVPRYGRRAVVATEGREPLSRRMWGRRPGRPGECPPPVISLRRGIEMEITFKGRRTSVPERFRRHASAKLAKLEKLDHNAIRVDVEVSTERNPRQADRSERVELTIRSRGPAIRAEAAADDRYTALDLALAKIESRLRRAADRRKVKHGDNVTVRSPEVLAGGMPAVAAAPGEVAVAPRRARSNGHNGHGAARPRAGGVDDQPGPAESGLADFDDTE